MLQPENDPYKELIEPAVHGTKNLLSSVAKSKESVKRVVLTSSVAGDAQAPNCIGTALAHQGRPAAAPMLLTGRC